MFSSLRFRPAEVSRRSVRSDRPALVEFVQRHGQRSRDSLVAEGLLRPGAPEPGTSMLHWQWRSPMGAELLTVAEALLDAVLYEPTDLELTHRELLTLVVPEAKRDAGAFGFLRACTEVGVSGTWRDPAGSAHDTSAANVLIQVEYGDTDDELVGNVVVVCLGLINALRVNEQVLYARMHDVEQSTLTVLGVSVG